METTKDYTNSITNTYFWEGDDEHTIIPLDKVKMHLVLEYFDNCYKKDLILVKDEIISCVQDH